MLHLLKLVDTDVDSRSSVLGTLTTDKPDNRSLIQNTISEDEAEDIGLNAALSDPVLLAIVFSFLPWKDILKCRVCHTWRQAALITDVPESISNDALFAPDLYVNSRKFAEALKWLFKVLPRVPSLNIRFNMHTTRQFDIADGENPTRPFIASTSRPVSLACIANFRHLQNLSINGTSLNGSYPFLFDYPELRSLELVDVGRLVWDLEMLKGLPKLEKLTAVRNTHLTGRLSSIKVLRQSLVELSLACCFKVGGDLMELRDFPYLKAICLNDCNRIGGDIRDIRTGDFESVESFGKLPDSVFGGSYLPSIADTPAIMHAWYILKKQNPSILSSSGNGLSRLSLSILSTERYHNEVHHTRYMPTCVEFVYAASRLGWRWTNAVRGGSCETIWLDPAPNPTDEGYEVYLRDLHRVNQDVGFYKGFFAPPSREEHLHMNEKIPFAALT